MVHKYVQPIVNSFIEAAKGKASEIVIKAIEYERIIEDVNLELKALRVPALSLPREVLLVLFAAFQGMLIKLASSIDVRLGFFVLPQSHGIEVCAAFHDPAHPSNQIVFPVFSMPNFCAFPEVMPDLFQDGWSLVRVPFINGKLEAFQTHEMIEKDMPKKLFAHANIPLRTRVAVEGWK